MEIKKIIPMAIDQVLNRMDLERRRSMGRTLLPVVGGFVVGAIGGALLLMALAPESAHELRGRIERGLANLRSSGDPSVDVADGHAASGQDSRRSMRDHGSSAGA